MPIHDQSYRRYKGARESARSAWTVIAIAGIRSFLARRVMLMILIVSWVQLVVKLLGFYLSENIAQAATFFGPSTKTFRDFFDIQNFFVFLIAIYVGSGLIAQDRRANALQIYLSKPLTRLEYIAGKMSILVAFLLFVTWVPAMMLLIGQIVLSGSFAFALLALSSLTTSTRYVAVMFAGVMFFTEAIYGTLRAITGSSAVSWVSFSASLAQVGDAIFRVPLRYDTPVIVSLIVLVALVAVSVSVLERRVRGVEVVA
jgi:ABC-type transport system involved in multi-copper enzyme maturation permease subunit